MNLKVATYNIWSGRNNTEIQTRNYDWTADVISEIGPDIVGLQEVGKGPCYGFSTACDIEDVPECLGENVECMHILLRPLREIPMEMVVMLFFPNTPYRA